MVICVLLQSADLFKIQFCKMLRRLYHMSGIWLYIGKIKPVPQNEYPKQYFLPIF